MSRIPARQKQSKHGITSFSSNWQMYVMALPAMALLFMFNYMPMFGAVIAFKRYKVRRGIFGSDWMNPWYKNFMLILKPGSDAMIAVKNTLLLNLMFIAVGTIFALMLALMFNEIRSNTYKRITQSITFLPHFISTVVVGIFAVTLLSNERGTINALITGMGGQRINFYDRPEYWPFILLCFNIWKGAGYNSVVYLATIGGIDTSYYEAARIDGASRWQETWYISLPMLRPTIIVLTLLAIGRIMNADFGFFYNITGDSVLLRSTTDVIDTYIYRALRVTGDMAISSATGLFQSTVSFILIVISNLIARRIDESSALF